MQKKTWIKKRHALVWKIAYLILAPYCKLRYHVQVERFPAKKGQAYLILLNHQTPFDQFFVGMSFRDPIYFLATEDLFSNGWVSSLIRFLVAPIPIKKQTTDITAVKNCIRVAREGGTIAIAPEGNRTYSGKTEYMRPSIASLAKKLKLPVVLYRIEGGYGAQPRWSDCIRKGKMHAYVSRVIQPEEYEGMTNEELFDQIRQGLTVCEDCSDSLYKSSKKAEYLERAIYVCPDCGLSKFESHGNEVECLTCHKKIRYGEDKRLTGVDFQFPFPYVRQWYEYQADFVNALDVMQYTAQPLFCDRADLYRVILNKRKVLLGKDRSLRLFGDRVEIGEDMCLPFGEISAVTVLGRNKLNIYHGDNVYQFKGGKRFNALKYVNIYFRYKNINGGTPDGKFLGI